MNTVAPQASPSSPCLLLPLALASPSPPPTSTPHSSSPPQHPHTPSYTLTLGTLTLGTLVPQVMVAVAKGLNAPVKIMFPKVRP